MTTRSLDGAASSKRTLLRATAASAASRAVSFPLTLAVSSLLTHHLSRPDYAFYGSLNSLSMLFIVFAQLGYQTSIVRILGEHNTRHDRTQAGTDFVAALLTTALASCVLGLAFLQFGTGWLPNDQFRPQYIFVVVAILFGLRALNVLTAEALRGLGRVGMATNFSGLGTEGGVVRVIVSLMLLIMLTRITSLTLLHAIIVGAVSSAVCLAFSVTTVLRKTGMPHSGSAVMQSARSHFHSNTVIMTAQALQIASSASVANLIGANTLPAAALAGMIAAVQVMNMILAPLTLLNGAAPALLIRLKNEGKHDEMEELVRLGSSAAFLVALCVGVTLFVLGPVGFQLVFGPAYRDSYLHYCLLLPGLLTAVHTGMAGRAILMLGDVAQHRRVMIVSTLLALPIYFAGARLFGSYGLSAAISLNLIIQNVMLVVTARKNLNLSTCASFDPRYYVQIVGQAVHWCKKRLK